MQSPRDQSDIGCVSRAFLSTQPLREAGSAAAARLTCLAARLPTDFPIQCLPRNLSIYRTDNKLFAPLSLSC